MILLVAVGNPFRRDDGVAERIVARSAIDPSRIEVRVEQQLTPELAEDVARSDAFVVIDAATGENPGRISLRSLKGNLGPNALSHFCRPEELVALADDLFGRSPPSFLLTVVGADFAHGEGLSEIAERAATRAADALEHLLVTLVPQQVLSPQHAI